MKFPVFKCRKDNVPIISNAAIEDTIDDILRDFDSSLLEVPQALNVDEFVEEWLGIDLDFPFLSHTGFIFGKTIFRPTLVTIYDNEKGIADEIPIDSPTILIDNRLNEKGNENLYRSTTMHESAHYIFHRDYYMQDPRYMKQEYEPFANCSKKDICGSDGKKKFTTAREFLEHHAKYASAAFLMNRHAMTVLCTDKSVIREAYRRDPMFPNYELSTIVADTFKVSEESARIRMRTLKLELSQDIQRPTSQIHRITLAGITT